MDAALNTAPCGYFTFNHTGALCTVNQTLCEWLGYGSGSELEGRDVQILFPIATRIFYQTHFFPLLRMQGYADEIFLSLVKKDKSDLAVLINAKRVGENEEATYAAVCIVVHHRKKFEEELIRAKNAAEKALRENEALQKLTSDLQKNTEDLDRNMAMVKRQNRELKQFSRVVTHDLQEPVRKLTLFSNMLRDENLMVHTDRMVSVAERMLNAATQMKSVVSALQQYVWLQEKVNKIESVSISSLLLRVKNKLIDSFGDVLEVEAGPIPMISADPDQIELLLFHLLSNAIKYRKPGSKAQVDITGVIIQQNRFREVRDRYQYAPFLQLEIRDHGVGFESQYSDQIFELFRKLHREEGRGLGLSLCKMVADNHGGSIRADSQPGVGTTITFLLPVS